MYLCSCNLCDGVFEDTNPQTGATVYPDYPVKALEDHCCPVCKTDDNLTDDVIPQYICSHCGSNDVRTKAWIHRNRKPQELILIIDGDLEDNECNSCGGNYPLVFVESESAKRLQEFKDVAMAFSRLINKYYSPEELAEVRRRNLLLMDDGICATHDYYDANEVMAEAMKETLGVGVDLRLDDHVSIWNHSWGIAKRNEFKVD